MHVRTPAGCGYDPFRLKAQGGPQLLILWEEARIHCSPVRAERLPRVQPMLVIQVAPGPALHTERPVA